MTSPFFVVEQVARPRSPLFVCSESLDTPLLPRIHTSREGVGFFGDQRAARPRSLAGLCTDLRVLRSLATARPGSIPLTADIPNPLVDGHSLGGGQPRQTPLSAFLPPQFLRSRPAPLVKGGTDWAGSGRDARAPKNMRAHAEPSLWVGAA